MDLTKIKEGTRVKMIEQCYDCFPIGATGTITHNTTTFLTDPITMRDKHGDFWIKPDKECGFSKICASHTRFKILRY